jgi:hypothetical protein
MGISVRPALSEMPVGAPGARKPQLFHDLDCGLAAGNVFRIHVLMAMTSVT